MKKHLLLVAILALSTAGTSFAQTTPTKAARKADHQTEQLAQELGLANDQKARVEQILLARTQELQALRAKGGSSADVRKYTADLDARYDSQLKEALSATQFANYQQLRAKH